jgi:hypothetical protein
MFLPSMALITLCFVTFRAIPCYGGSTAATYQCETRPSDNHLGTLWDNQLAEWGFKIVS